MLETNFVNVSLLFVFMSFSLVPPQIEGESSSFTFVGHEEKVKINGSLTLSCLAKGFPEPKVHWFKDGQVGVL